MEKLHTDLQLLRSEFQSHMRADEEHDMRDEETFIEIKEVHKETAKILSDIKSNHLSHIENDMAWVKSILFTIFGAVVVGLVGLFYSLFK